MTVLLDDGTLVEFTQDPRHPVTWTLDGFGLTHYDTLGCRWITQHSQGWRDGARVRTRREPREYGPGSFRSASFADELVITLSGTCWAPSADARAAAARRLAALCPPGGDLYRLVKVERDGYGSVRYVERDDPTVIDLVGDRWLDWQMQLAAPDPARYSTSWVSVGPAPAGGASSGGINTVTGGGITTTALGINTGTAGADGAVTARAPGADSAQLVLQLVGPSTDVRIFDDATESVITVRGDVAAGDALFINCGLATAYDVPGAAIPIPGRGAVLGESSARSALRVTGGWPELPPGVSRTWRLGGGAGGGSMLAVHSRGAWI